MNKHYQQITIRKLNLKGEETWRYTGHLISKNNNKIILEASFNMPDTPFHGVKLKRGDRFVETYFTDRWYNIFEIHDLHTDEIKGWYCNVGYPAVFDGGVLSYIDLALDLFVYPDGRQLVLDEDEFNELPLDPLQRNKSLAALEEIKNLFRTQN